MPKSVGLGRHTRLHKAIVAAPVKPHTKLLTRCEAVTRRWTTLSVALAPLLSVACSQQASAAIFDEEAAVAVFAVVAPSVVTIEIIATVQGRDVEEGVGSGFVWDKFGHIVTNSHVISKVAKDQTGTQRVRVTFNAGLNNMRSFDAQILVNEPSCDLAVLKVDATQDELVPVRVGSALGLRVGQYAFAIGNPSGFSRTLTSGIVSGLNRAIPSPVGTRIPGAIQTDAAISAGNSGGPLVDSSGRVVGVCTATFTRQGSGRSSGVNLAIPIDTVTSTIPHLIVKATG